MRGVALVVLVGLVGWGAGQEQCGGVVCAADEVCVDAGMETGGVCRKVSTADPCNPSPCPAGEECVVDEDGEGFACVRTGAGPARRCSAGRTRCAWRCRRSRGSAGRCRRGAACAAGGARARRRHLRRLR
eukprot:Sspe_Gene.41614::Locus_20136_Transcript_1_10_Confidence_0.368_Length_753::g.41614::m.41614